MKERDDEHALMRRVAAGEQAAFAELVRRNLPRILAVARRMLGEDAAAEDVAQDVLMCLWRKAACFDPRRAKLSTWLYRVTANLCVDRLRAKRLLRLEEDCDLPSAAPAQEQLVAERDLAVHVDRALQELPERQRLAVVLCHYEGLSLKEAGAVLSVSEEAVESLLARGRRKLRQRLWKQWRGLLPDAP